MKSLCLDKQTKCDLCHVALGMYAADGQWTCASEQSEESWENLIDSSSEDGSEIENPIVSDGDAEAERPEEVE